MRTEGKKQFTDHFTDFAQKWVPDSYVIALMLTIVAFILAEIFTPSSPFDIVVSWGKGFWTLLAFSMQMSLIVITGYALATTPVCKKLISSICSKPNSETSVYVYAVILASIGFYLNWGFGLIFAALICKNLAVQAEKKCIAIDYRYLCGAAWTPFYIWHMGLSGSAPLLVATADHFMVKDIGVIPISQTIFHPYNLILTVVSIIAIIILFGFILPPKDKSKIISITQFNPALAQENVIAVEKKPVITPSEWVSQTPWCSYIVGVMFLVYLYYHFFVLGKSLDINVLNFLFLTLIIFLYGSASELLKAVKASTPAAWGVILQFPFYAGIFGIMKYTGLVDTIAAWVITLSNASTFPAIAAILTGFISYFIPSGGSKWIIEAPFLIPAGQALGIPNPQTIIAYMFGGDLVALIQPFFAVPFMAVCGLEFKDFVGYSFVAFIILGIIMVLGLTFIPFSV
ncbi:short-chain fatty acid transporter [Megasphaera vaginalis (ex Srinivasan et al. 2021)]|uniref:short-chain fatty acid transporter n=1 Tax=Megasphaera vaginalis (ex Srinivasan et al. 2021) TaxID=1111454 RepID=UPI001E315EE0|nr:TIGR00366 family protein [Megasphaera vaginalis (ex Srinivasan et al. 2021)]